MNDEEYEKAKERVNYYLFPLKDILLGDWYIRYEYYRDPDEDEPNTAAYTRPLWQYKRGTIELRLQALMTEDDERLVNILVHEFVHCMLDPICEPSESVHYRNAVEFTTQTVTDSIMAMFERPDLFKQWHEKNDKKEVASERAEPTPA